MDKQTLCHEVVKRLHRCGHVLHFQLGCMSARNRILAQLDIHGELLQKELQDHLQIQSGSLSEIIIKMESEGLIEKVRSAKDGRYFVLRLTEKGLKEAHLRRAENDKISEDLMEHAEPEELQQLYDQLNKLLNTWHEKGILKVSERRNHD